MNATIFSGGCLELLPAFDLDRVLRILATGRVTKFFAVPTVYLVAERWIGSRSGWPGSAIFFRRRLPGRRSGARMAGADRAAYLRRIRPDRVGLCRDL